MMETVYNMDQLAAQHAQNVVSNTWDKEKKLVEILDRVVTKTLGVLQEQGVYAMMLFLFSRTSNEATIAPIVREELIGMLDYLPAFSNAAAPDPKDYKNTLRFYSDKVMDDLDTLFLVRDLYEQTLIYARFGAKAAENEKDAKNI